MAGKIVHGGGWQRRIICDKCGATLFGVTDSGAIAFEGLPHTCARLPLMQGLLDDRSFADSRTRG